MDDTYIREDVASIPASYVYSSAAATDPWLVSLYSTHVLCDTLPCRLVVCVWRDEGSSFPALAQSKFDAHIGRTMEQSAPFLEL